ncbi:hypothetical protein MRN59_05590 [Macrococcoides caseolyticum]|uniref:Uncharacterized protein n=3 Tax=Staphylococcaceae TaxID=90964 RepID=A0AAE6X1L9_9STAP|nr:MULTISPECIES: hypothetical protein [Macrococcus]PKE26175.1 hypothetical protein CW686_06610 [Macrococcus caseolyticus]PKE58689.1 hypothetical protein CW673_06730 [Macrococcus caseolyticus]QIH78323.1 hypothetical protein GTN30_06525 [Macrococcus canis]
MIKKFIDRLDNLSTEGWIAIMNYIDVSLDKLNDRSQKNEEKVDKLRKEFDELKDEVGDVKAIIDSNTELSKTIKKTALGTVVTLVIGYIGFKLGIVR